MCKNPYLLFASLSLALLMASVEAHASKLPLGINLNHGIFMQETWQGNTPLLCVTNRTGKDQTVQVSRWRSRQVPADPLQQWPLAVDAVRCHDISTLAAEDLIEFKLVGGAWLGLLRPPRAPPVESQNATTYSSFQGLNGACPTPGTWIEQSQLRLKAGQPASVTLLTTVNKADDVIEFSVDTRLNLPQLQLKSAVSTSLVVGKENRLLSIKPGPQTAMSSMHRIQLEIDVPVVTQPTMYLLSGRKRIANNGWQCFIRGMLVEP